MQEFRLLLSKHKQDEQNVWVRFEAELTKRTNLVVERHKDELHSLTARTNELEAAASVPLHHRSHEIESANRRVEDSLREAGELRKRNYELESEMAKVARVGKREEMVFADDVRTWAGIHISEKLGKNGDYLLAFRDPGVRPLSPIF